MRVPSSLANTRLGSSQESVCKVLSRSPVEMTWPHLADHLRQEGRYHAAVLESKNRTIVIDVSNIASVAVARIFDDRRVQKADGKAVLVSQK